MLSRSDYVWQEQQQQQQQQEEEKEVEQQQPPQQLQQQQQQQQQQATRKLLVTFAQFLSSVLPLAEKIKATLTFAILDLSLLFVIGTGKET
jgi:predicted anti-sigma-YlaC factor YlaD